jgi:putative DNA methylase
MTPYPKRLIEVDLPIARISAHARREKSIRHGHISTLHIWWARRPLAACRAVILASLWPDPVDLAEWANEADAKGEVRAPKGEALKPGEGVIVRPKRFLDEARQRMTKWSQIALGKASNESYKLLVQVLKNPKLLDDPATLRTALLDFIADFADWDHSTDKDYLETSRALVQAAHEALVGGMGTRPMVIDPFAGGGSIPLEALRVGADVFASDLNPIPVLLNKVVLEYIPKHGKRLADEVRKWGAVVKEQAEAELGQYFPEGPDRTSPVAYLWARTVLSEAPGQGDIPLEVPLIRSLWLTKKTGRKRAMRWVRDKSGRVQTQVIDKAFFLDGQRKVMKIRRPLLEVFQPERDSEVESGSVARGSATCPVSGFTTTVDRVRLQLQRRKGGTADARMYCVVSTSESTSGRQYRVPGPDDLNAVEAARVELVQRVEAHSGRLSLVPNEQFTGLEPRRIPLPQYGMTGFGDLFTPRQMLAHTTLVRLVRQAAARCAEEQSGDFARAVHTLLAFAVDRCVDKAASLVVWNVPGEKVEHVFGRQAMPMVWDFADANILGDIGWDGAIEWIAKVVEANADTGSRYGDVQQASATQHPLPDDSVDAVVTDPPYYFSVPYSDLSDFFYVWLRRTLGVESEVPLPDPLTPKDLECVQNLPHSEVAHVQKTRGFFEDLLTQALKEARRVARPSGTAVVVFAHTETEAWESLLAALVGAGWCVTGSWPIDTEMATRLISNRQATLSSSIHLVCRPRESATGGAGELVGEWREVLAELPARIGDWMPRLAKEGVVGADAIFACIGPALEIFSRYSRVEKASGEAVTLREYLEHVWAAVSSEALSMIFKEADAAGLEPDARLTAMWLWTLGGGKTQTVADADAEQEGEGEDDEAGGGKTGAKVSGFVLEFDAARKIAQGLGIHLEKSESIVEVKGESARLLPVSERTRHLFGQDAEQQTSSASKAKKRKDVANLFQSEEEIKAEIVKAEAESAGKLAASKAGATVLDRVHQSMLLFATGRGEALKRFLVEDGVGKDGRFWKLAQSLSALYPSGTDEKRWVDGVLARKKGLGF